jgi:hypothetical protein
MNQRDDLFPHSLSACQVNDSCSDLECASCGGKVLKSCFNLLGPRIVIQGLGSIGWDDLTNSLGLIKPIFAWEECLEYECYVKTRYIGDPMEAYCPMRMLQKRNEELADLLSHVDWEYQAQEMGHVIK